MTPSDDQRHFTEDSVQPPRRSGPGRIVVVILAVGTTLVVVAVLGILLLRR